jgi:hypothetical protein
MDELSVRLRFVRFHGCEENKVDEGTYSDKNQAGYERK